MNSDAGLSPLDEPLPLLGSWQWDLGTGVVRWSPELFTIFGEDPASFTPSVESFLSRIHPDDRDSVRVSLETARREGAPFQLVERIVRRDGTRRLLSRGSVETDAAGAAVRMFGTCLDITDQKASVESRQEARNLEAIGRLAGGVAHDFNNLLTTILGYSELILDTLPKDDESRAGVLEIEKAGRRAADLTSQLLAFSRQQVLSPTVLDPNELLSSLADELRASCPPAISIQTLLSTDVLPIKADRTQLRLVIRNLFENARDAMPNGGTITLESWNVEASGGIRPNGTEPLAAGRYVRISMTDTGSGMDAAARLRVFEPFFTTKGRSSSRGLGLATVHGIVAQSGGTVACESKPGSGSTFHVFLPTTEEHRVAKGSGSHIPGLQGTETVLLVDDEPGVRELAHTILTRHGHKVLEARDAREAFDLAEVHGESIDLLLTDIVLPDVRGPQVADALTRRLPGLRVLYMSGFTDPEGASRDGDPEGSAPAIGTFLQKPFTSRSLLSKVREALETPE